MPTDKHTHQRLLNSIVYNFIWRMLRDNWGTLTVSTTCSHSQTEFCPFTPPRAFACIEPCRIIIEGMSSQLLLAPYKRFGCNQISPALCMLAESMSLKPALPPLPPSHAGSGYFINNLLLFVTCYLLIYSLLLIVLARANDVKGTGVTIGALPPSQTTTP